MFNWNVEEMKLMNEHYMMGRNKIYYCEKDVSREDKIAFIDKIHKGKMTYLLNLIYKFNQDKESLPKDQWGYVKTVSLKAWLKRNDPYEMIDRNYQYGNIRFLRLERYIWDAERKYHYDKRNSLVDECFYRQLQQCEQTEKEYFLSHDEYSILKKELIDYMNRFGTSFDVKIVYSSSGSIFIEDKNDYNKKRDITMDELKFLISKYQELEAFVDTLAMQINIVY